jgi:hypothetical protein
VFEKADQVEVTTTVAAPLPIGPSCSAQVFDIGAFCCTTQRRLVGHGMLDFTMPYRREYLRERQHTATQSTPSPLLRNSQPEI